MDSSLELAMAYAIDRAKARGAEDVTADDLLVGGLFAIARFGIANLGTWSLDLEQMGLDWTMQPGDGELKVSYSPGAVEIFDRTVRIASVDGFAKPEVEHLLAAFAAEEGGLMGEFKKANGITSAAWRVALVERMEKGEGGKEAATGPAKAAGPAGYLTTEEAAAALGVHVQTLRGYIRSGKLPAQRLAGERAIRIRREDLEKLLEPMQTTGLD
jgi:excisionase family DNA binding protein